jgi:hypothetical protein
MTFFGVDDLLVIIAAVSCVPGFNPQLFRSVDLTGIVPEIGWVASSLLPPKIFSDFLGLYFFRVYSTICG